MRGLKLFGGFGVAVLLVLVAVLGLTNAFKEAPLKAIGDPQYLSNFLVDEITGETNIAERIPLAEATQAIWINRKNVGIKQIYLVTDDPTIDVYEPVLEKKQLQDIIEGISSSNFSYVPPSSSNGLAIKLTHLFLIEGTDGLIYTLSIRGLKGSAEDESDLFSKISQLLPAMTFQKVLENVKVSLP